MKLLLLVKVLWIPVKFEQVVLDLCLVHILMANALCVCYINKEQQWELFCVESII